MLPVDVSQPQAILELAQQIKADLTVVGPEAPLVAGVVDEFEKAGLWIVGPTQGGGAPGRQQDLLQAVHAAARAFPRRGLSWRRTSMMP